MSSAADVDILRRDHLGSGNMPPISAVAICDDESIWAAIAGAGETISLEADWTI